LWCETVRQNETTSKKVTILKVVDFAKILLLMAPSWGAVFLFGCSEARIVRQEHT